MFGRFSMACLVAYVAVLTQNVSRGDVVTDWNNAALNVIRAQRENPPKATRALAMMHVAIYDAVNASELTYEPYFVDRPAPPGASTEAAAAVAGHDVLSALYPGQVPLLAVELTNSLASIPSGPAKNKGIAWGRSVASKILKLRSDDGADDAVVYQATGEFGAWQPTPPAFAPALLPQWPYVTPFAMTTSDQFRVPAPPSFTSADYAAAFDEVKDLGALASATRTAEETLIAYFWEDGAGTVTPPGHWQVIAQQLSMDFGLSVMENARLFALLSITQADAAIASWDCKYAYNHVRPVTAIRQEADLDDNDETSADPTWLPLLPTPPFPAYTSGHSTFSGSSAKLLALFFGTDEIPFSMGSPDPNRWPNVLPGVVRSWNSLSEAAAEAGQSRIYGGIHWQYDNQQGLHCGNELADYVFANFLRPNN